MRRVVALALLSSGLVVGAVACDDEPPPSTDGIGLPVVDPPPRQRAQDSIYDGEGRLRESDETVAGLRLPMGLDAEPALSTERRHVFHSDVPPQKLLQYFGPRLNTLEIEHEGEIVSYRDATPQGVRGGVVRLDVTIQPTSGRPSRVEVYERPPPPVEGVVTSEEAIRAHLDTLRPERRE